MKSITALKFPLTFNTSAIGIEVISDNLDIKQSLFVLFSTHPGERKVHQDYGCNLRQFLFERSSSKVINDVRNEVEKAILKFEKRINIYSLDVNRNSQEEGEFIEIHLLYKIKETGEIGEFKFKHDYE